jgi:hypothetical protein
MGKSLLRVAVAVAAVMLAVRPAASWTCNDFSTLATKAVNAIRAMGGCGFDLTNSLYSTNPGTHYRWCRAMENSDREAVETRLKDLTAQAEKCEYCNSYATFMSDAARDNIAYGCGFRDNGYLWSPHRNLHFNGCMAYGRYEGCTRVFVFVCAGSSTHGEDAYYAKSDLDPNVGEVLRKIAECKKEHPVPKGCMSGCHETQKPSALLPAALRPPPKRGSHDFSVARQPPSIKQEGTSSGGSDKAQPSGERRRTPSGSSTSAMDRLGGGGMGGAPSGGGQSGERSAPRPSAGGGASSETPSGRAPNIGINTIMKPGGTSPGQGQSPGLR